MDRTAMKPQPLLLGPLPRLEEQSEGFTSSRDDKNLQKQYIMTAVHSYVHFLRCPPHERGQRGKRAIATRSVLASRGSATRPRAPPARRGHHALGGLRQPPGTALGQDKPPASGRDGRRETAHREVNGVRAEDTHGQRRPKPEARVCKSLPQEFSQLLNHLSICVIGQIKY